MAEEKGHEERWEKKQKGNERWQEDTQENELRDGQKCQALSPDECDCKNTLWQSRALRSQDNRGWLK